jgi:hypothetical protein
MRALLVNPSYPFEELLCLGARMPQLARCAGSA